MSASFSGKDISAILFKGTISDAVKYLVSPEGS